MSQPVTSWMNFFLGYERKQNMIEGLRNLKLKYTFKLHQKTSWKLVFTSFSLWCAPSRWHLCQHITCFVIMSGLRGLGSQELWTDCFTLQRISHPYSCVGQMLFKWREALLHIPMFVYVILLVVNKKKYKIDGIAREENIYGQLLGRPEWHTQNNTVEIILITDYRML